MHIHSAHTNIVGSEVLQFATTDCIERLSAAAAAAEGKGSM